MAQFRSRLGEIGANIGDIFRQRREAELEEERRRQRLKLQGLRTIASDPRLSDFARENVLRQIGTTTGAELPMEFAQQASESAVTGIVGPGGQEFATTTQRAPSAVTGITTPSGEVMPTGIEAPAPIETQPLLAPVTRIGKTTTLQQDLIAAGLKPGSREFREAILRAKTRPLVSTKAESAEQVELAKARSKRWLDLAEQSDAAHGELDTAKRLRRVRVKATTGKFAEYKLEFAKALEAAGFEKVAKRVADAASGEAFRSISRSLLFNLLAQQKGVQSESDLRMMRESIPDLTTTEAGVDQILKAMESRASRTIEKRLFVDKWMDDKGSLKGSFGAWEMYTRKVPIISRVLKDDDGLPVYWYRFLEEVRLKNPNATDDEIRQAWIDMNQTGAR
jgi:hypothetical protein